MSSSSASPSTSTWFITGCSGGFGRELVLALLSRNQRVVATARKLDSIKDLEKKGAVLAQWDVTDELEVLQKKAKEIDELVGGVGVVVNNAGFLVAGTFEETSPADDHRQFDTNVFGFLNTTRAFLPLFRSRNSGTFVNISSIAGVQGYGASGLYCSSKFAIEGITESLAAEVSHLGIRCTIVEPGYFRTNFLGAGGPPKVVGSIADYHAVTEPMEAALNAYNGKQPGDPSKGSHLIIDAVLGEGWGKGKELPLRLPLGPDAVATLEAKARENLKILEEWREASASTNHEDVV
ncbi:hypothetical protein BCR35DRAFT_280557 [Leucosporidium creatinivorum]|uniref:Ketoreductase domain-containing protein n=1 Tax=Leucosporidium creatinivorum TaxID=106004 RepID=A0A1Y2EXT7_9BASI|nr:hypothetical protein BCR35DRAFT_280557 [Leucosporidium creatinivorum]